jgi:hypothetical protein
MQSSADREKLLIAYDGVGSSPSGAIARCGAGLVLFWAVATGAMSANPGDASRGQTREAARGRLAVEQPSIAHAREIHAGRRAARAPITLDLLVRQ